ncbi:uncharacterized, partial [Tachysurus ichikawai]
MSRCAGAVSGFGAEGLTVHSATALMEMTELQLTSELQPGQLSCLFIKTA